MTEKKIDDDNDGCNDNYDDNYGNFDDDLVITGAKIIVGLLNYTFSDSSGRKLQHGPMLEKIL